MSAVAAGRGIAVIEDAAQAIGARYRGRRVGSLGSAGCFSLHPLKNLGVYGDGGLITTDDDALVAKLRLLRNHGLRNRDECAIWGYNSRLDPLQAAFAEIKLEFLETWNARCAQIARRYAGALNTVVDVPHDAPQESAVYHNFVIRSPARDALQAHLHARGVDTRVHYPIPIHLQPAARELGYREGDFPNCERFARTMLSLPIFPELTDGEIDAVIDAVQSFDASHGRFAAPSLALAH